MNLVKTRQFIVLISLLLSLPLFIAGKPAEGQPKPFKSFGPFKLLGRIPSVRGGVDVVEDANKQKFIIKEHFCSSDGVAEALAAAIGKEVINTNQVQIFPSNKVILNGKEINNITTVHMYIEGEQIKNEHDNIDNDFINEAITTREHLKNLVTKHAQLKDIAAFNIFINNRDCNNGNVLLHKKTNQLYGIDFASAFIPLSRSSELLAARTGDYLQSLNKEELSLEEIKVLKHIRQTLKILSNQYPPTELYRLWVDIGKQANYNPDLSTQKEMSRYMNTNFNEIQYLCYRINRLIKKPLSLKSVFKNMARPSEEAEQNFWQTVY